MDSEGKLKASTIAEGLNQVENQRSRGDMVAFIQPAAAPDEGPPPAAAVQQAAAGEGGGAAGGEAAPGPAGCGGEGGGGGGGGLRAHRLAMDALRRRLEGRLAPPLAGMERTSLMVARYPGNGTGYVRHRDSSPNCPGRKLTAILYLNPGGWDPGSDGGRLVLYRDDGDGDAGDDCEEEEEEEEEGEHPSSSAAAVVAEEDHKAAEAFSCRGDEAGGQLLNEREKCEAASNKGEVMRAKKAQEIEQGLLSGRVAAAPAPLAGRLVLFRSALEHEVEPCFRDRFAVTAWFYNKKHMALELIIEQLQNRKR